MGTPTACLDILFLFGKHFVTLRMKVQIVCSTDINYEIIIGLLDVLQLALANPGTRDEINKGCWAEQEI